MNQTTPAQTVCPVMPLHYLYCTRTCTYACLPATACFLHPGIGTMCGIGVHTDLHLCATRPLEMLWLCLLPLHTHCTHALEVCHLPAYLFCHPAPVMHTTTCTCLCMPERVLCPVFCTASVPAPPRPFPVTDHCLQFFCLAFFSAPACTLLLLPALWHICTLHCLILHCTQTQTRTGNACIFLYAAAHLPCPQQDLPWSLFEPPNSVGSAVLPLPDEPLFFARIYRLPPLLGGVCALLHL